MKEDMYYIDSEIRSAAFELGNKLFDLIKNIDKEFNNIAFVCIGTDRSTGDCYGPLVGHFLSKIKLYEFDLYGTLEEPVHAININKVLDEIDMSNTLIIGIDASLGRLDNIKNIRVGCGGIRPGSGVGKELPMIGDIHLAGIVNISGFMPIDVLQNTRLNTVYRMAEVTASAIQFALYEKEIYRKSTMHI
ncbi:spore protease YyaC [Alkaliphilus sp. B6464]|uniref:spore protease YyaC n=1 Tax=Alkaliphilus sp. B6464 TaxID=2731219 RepID=UPI001BAD2BB6|nr:spore protease YyaC [Alkaliphilus sp. B6464]QUH22212.1 spore protease YyaC [Alkaliphilus sp. B6464]